MNGIEFLGTVVWVTDDEYKQIRSVPRNEQIRDATEVQIKLQRAREAAEHRWGERIAKALFARKIRDAL